MYDMFVIFLHEKTNKFYIRATFRHEFIFWQRKSNRKLYTHGFIDKHKVINCRRMYFAMMVVKMIDSNQQCM